VRAALITILVLTLATSHLLAQSTAPTYTGPLRIHPQRRVESSAGNGFGASHSNARAATWRYQFDAPVYHGCYPFWTGYGYRAWHRYPRYRTVWVAPPPIVIIDSIGTTRW
jgi:hypothetical protein